MGRPLGFLLAGMASVTAATTTKSPTAVAVSPFNLQTCTALVSSVMYRSLANEYAIACAEDVPELTSGQPNQALTRLGKSPITDATVAKMLATNACRMWYGNLAMTIATMSPPCTYTDTLTGQTAATNKYTATMSTYVALLNEKAIQSAGNSTQPTISTITFSPPAVDSSALGVVVAIHLVVLAVVGALL